MVTYLLIHNRIDDWIFFQNGLYIFCLDAFRTNYHVVHNIFTFSEEKSYPDNIICCSVVV